MKKMKWSVVAAMLCMAIVGFNINSQAAPQIILRYFVLTAPTSTNNMASQQNAMSLMDRNGDIGTIDTDIANHPGALNMPCTLRACDIMFSPANFYMWDATNAPTGNFAQENGKRLGWGLDWKDTNVFHVSDIWFQLQSYEGSGSLDYPANPAYPGNLAINTDGGVPLTFSPTLKGEFWGPNGISYYHNGETISDHPVNRVVALIRLGWLCNSMTDVTNDLRYFGTHIENPPFRHSAKFYMLSGAGATSWITSQSCLVASHAPVGINENVTIEGQRQLLIALSYGLQRIFALGNTNYDWTTVVYGGLQDGSVYASTPANTMASSQAYYRAFEVIGDYALSKHSSLGDGIKTSRPIPVVSNGTE